LIMRKILFGVVLTLGIILAFTYFFKKTEKRKELTESSALIREQVNNVGKIIVTEGHFAEVYKYEDIKKIMGINYLTAEKKALVVVNAEVNIVYDLREIEYELDSIHKILKITKIPSLEIKMNPNLEYYDVKQDFLNPFNADDYNLIKGDVEKIILNKIELSSLKTNAENRLISELSKFFILTNSLGWSLEYQSKPINKLSEFEMFKK